MLFGPRGATVLATQPVDIHGTHMLDVVFKLDGESEPRSARLGYESLPERVQVGDRVLVHMLMNVATRIEPEQR